MSEPTEQQKAAIWDHINGESRDFEPGPREQAVIDGRPWCICQRGRHEPNCRLAESVS